MGAQKSANNQGAQEVGSECWVRDGEGETDPAEFSGATYGSGVVPGAEMWHLEKK